MEAPNENVSTALMRIQDLASSHNVLIDISFRDQSINIRISRYDEVLELNFFPNGMYDFIRKGDQIYKAIENGILELISEEKGIEND